MKKNILRLMLLLAAVFVGTTAMAQHGQPVDRSSLDEPPTGYVNGLFTVNEWGTQVYFSQGNLQYVDGEWRFAEHQWDYLGDNGQGSASEDVTRDLFGWGTSGLSHGAVSYQPWSTSQTPGDYYAYGDAGYNLFDESGQADWGANGIANGGGVAGLWRVPTREEWEWLLFERTTTSGLRFAKAKVNGVRGVILLPDAWMASYHALSNANSTSGRYKDNVVTATEWESDFEAHGAVFLPAAGYRFGERLWYPGKRGSYCSATACGSLHAWNMVFDETSLRAGTSVSRRGNGFSVRLVATSTGLWFTEVTTGEVTDVTSNSATASGTVTTDGGTVIIATGVCWNTDPDTDPTIEGDHTDEGALTGDFTSALTGLERNTTYYVRAYATDGEGDTMYGEVVEFTTLAELPAVTTAAVTEIDITAATAGGEVTDDGGTEVTECGVCWGTDPETELTIDGSHVAATTPGMGAFTVALTGLTQNTTYYVCAYVTNSVGTVYGETVSFTTLRQPWAITATANPSGGGTVTGANTYYQGDQCTLTATAATGYTFTKWTKDGTDYSTDATISFTVTAAASFVAVFTLNTYNVSASANPPEGGSVTGANTYNHGSGCTLVATPATGYTFTKWTKDGTDYSTDATISFTVTAAASFVAVFTLNTYNVSASANPPEGGSVTGANTYNHGSGCTLVATPADGYAFVNWTENDSVVSTNDTLTFTVTAAHTLVANFKLAGIVSYSAFSVREGYQVLFSQGNLQYQASTKTWQFAEHQYDYVGNANSSISQTNSGWIDLFGWGTSGYDHGAVCYQPWSTSSTYSDYYAYGIDTYNLNDQTGQADWGVHNAISNGGNTAGTWRTLTQPEWDYLFNTRTTASGIRYAKACVNNINGVILLPDDWSTSYYSLYSTNTNTANFSSNIISADNWATLEQHGAVFLPAAGSRIETSVTSVGSPHGYYWSASCSRSSSAWYVSFYDSDLYTDYSDYRFYGQSVRLVRPAQDYSYVIEATPNSEEYGTVSGGDSYTEGSQCTLTATANEGYVFVNWTETIGDDNPKVVSTSATYTFRVQDNRTLVANFELSGPQGALKGAFSVRDGYQVLFSKGNLQYIGSADTAYWKFADHQWVCLGTTTGQNSSAQDVDRDLFGWGTSGWNNGNINYQPWSTSLAYIENSLCFGYGPTDGTSYEYDLTGAYAEADWGVHNAIYNGGNTTNIWRTLTTEEWDYLFNTRSTTSGLRYAKACVNNVNGVILLPDDWSADYYNLGGTNSTNANYSANPIDTTQWSTLEQHGVVFLPTSGYRNGNGVHDVGSYGCYWSTSHSEESYAYYAYFFDDTLVASWDSSREYGRSVRLVRPAQDYSFNIEALANSSQYGTVSEGGTFAEGSQCTLTATPNEGYVFFNWTEAGTDGTPKVVSTSATYTFRVQDNSILVANFKPVGTASNSAFSVRDGYQVFFSQGNLQYQGSTKTWQFAEQQYDYVGNANCNISDTCSGWIDLFGWGTSGYNHGANCYQPWSASTSPTDYYAYGSYTYNLNDSTGKADWGYNAISNGGNTENSGWRTLTHEEWTYLFNTRNTTSGIRYAKAKVNGIKGVILLPDDWSTSYYTLENPNGGNYSSNDITAGQWATLEQHGAAFLPAAGYRGGTSVYDVGSVGNYWSASCGSSSYAWGVYFYDSSLSTDYYGNRCNGRSVRLVRPAQDYSFVIEANPSSEEYGSVSGGGEYAEGAECTLTATANEGYVFVNWTEGNKVVSTSATYTFRVQDNRTLVANFKLAGIVSYSAFSVREGYQVLFSQGNLQYQASTKTWQFAEQQYDFVGDANGNISDTYSGWIDLFGWGTSGYNHGATCYQPWSTSSNPSDYYAYGSDTYNLNDFTGKADWGYNAISNGGGTENNGWRTLTQEEWAYLFKTRTTTSGIRYAKAKVNGINGVILLPDDWSSSYYLLSNTNTSGASFAGNIVTSSDWTDSFEAHGAVFLPAAGRRYVTSVDNVGSNGYYWSASYYNSNNAKFVYFFDSYLSTDDNNSLRFGQSVRLVRPAQDYSFVIEANPNSEEYGTVSGGGTYTEGAECSLTATANEGYAFVNWTEGNTVVSTSATYTFRVQDNRNLVANFKAIPQGAVSNSAFSVRDGYQVLFSKGNLQYQGSTNTWQFAEHQYDCVGNANSSISSTYSGWIDLFGWGTSGYDHGATCYQPWSTSTNGNDYYAYGNYGYNLNDRTGQADWGYNPISNGGGIENSGWRTLTKDEWAYLFNIRGGENKIRYAKAQVNNVNGVILLPDDWSTSYYTLENPNGGNYSSNEITAAQWSTLEQHGAVFLPAAGYRYGTSVDNVGSCGGYWSASCNGSNGAWDVYFDDSNLSTDDNYYRDSGQSVRLVRSSQDYTFTITASASSTEYGTVSGGGSYTEGSQCTLTATANEGYAFVNWTEGNKVVSTSRIYTFRVRDNRNLVANFEALPTGAARGKFSVNANGDKVYFSKGNLQYIGSAGNGDENNTGAYWQFAENQWDCLGTTTGQNSDAKNVDRDLFGWGTSGWYNGNTYYQPWCTSYVNNSQHGFGYGPTDGTSYEYDLTGAYAEADWGVHNAISIGGNTESSGWRTLTHEEWVYLFNTRGGENQIRYAKACVNNVNGVILLPDDWSTNYYLLENPNGGSYSDNTITVDNWTTLEQHGAVFLPAAGYRYGTSVDGVGSYGYYWSASCSRSSSAWYVRFFDSYLNAGNFSYRDYGQSVRLVRSSQ